MIAKLTAVFAFLAPSVALGQTIVAPEPEHSGITTVMPPGWLGHTITTPNGWSNCSNCGDGVLHTTQPRHASTGDADLDKAVDICDAHGAITNLIDGDASPMYFLSGCDKVINAWTNSKSEKDKREAEKQAKEDADRAWLETYVKGLKP